MKTIVLAYHPNHIKPEDLQRLGEEFKALGAGLLTIAHYNDRMEPIYYLCTWHKDDK